MSSVRRTNQALYFARLSLDKAEQAQQDAQGKRYSEECALFHIYAATLSFAGEVVVQCGLEPFNDLAELLSRDALPGDLNELSLLINEPSSWLGSLVGQYKRVVYQGLDDSVANSGLIFSQSDYSTLFANWLIELENIVQRMREHYQEY
jgi:hypothetical protein